MSSEGDLLRTALERKFQPPVDVLLDPSLLVADRSLDRVSKSRIFSSQRQATLGGSPTKPRLGTLHVPKTFHETASQERQSAAQQTEVWDFFRGQAEAAFPDDVEEVLQEYDVKGFSASDPSAELAWNNPIGDSDRNARVVKILGEVAAFLHSGGVVLSRTPATVKTLRDGGVATVDVGKGELEPELAEALDDIGFQDSAPICFFGVSGVGSTVGKLLGSVLSSPSDLLLYRVGE